MGWVLKSWRPGALAALAADAADDGARRTLADAERSARRALRRAGRELAALESVAEHARGEVRAERGRLRGAGQEPAPFGARRPAAPALDDGRRPERAPALLGEPRPAPAPGEALPLVARDIRPARPARPRRAVVRESPLAELFRATAATQPADERPSPGAPAP
jgi:hypothetical protein